MAEDALVESLCLNFYGASVSVATGEATSLCRWALEWSPIASIQLAARA